MENSDYPLSEVPNSERKGLLSTSAVLLGFTFFTATMWAGGSLGSAFSFGQLLGVILIGNLLLGAYAAALAYIACHSGLNSVLMGLFGLAFCVTAMVGFRGRGLLSRFAVPAMMLFILISLYTGMVDLGSPALGPAKD